MDHSNSQKTAPEAKYHNDEPKGLDRRSLLRGAGAATAAMAAAPLLPLTSHNATSSAQETPPPPAMRSPRNQFSATVIGDGKPDLPPMSVLALNRMGFGPRPGDIEAFNALGSTDQERLEAYVAQQLDPESIDDSVCDAQIAAQQFETLDKSLEQLWADHIRSEAAKEWQYRRLPVWETERATLIRALYSKRQLVEVLADFWHNHFNVYGWDSWIQSTFVHYDRDVIRGQMLGNFRQLLGAVAKSPAMLYYLDNQSNSGGNPNENYARELFELHTLGAENYMGVVPLIINDSGGFEHPAPKDENGRPLLYVDEDVYGATTCFTGWRIDEESGLFRFDEAAHFPYQKLVLGQAIPALQNIKDGEDVLDILANHTGTATHICRKLCRRLISDHPPESIVQAAADVFHDQREAPDQLKQVVRTILLSEEFRTTWGEKIRRPFQFVSAVMRAAECDFDPKDNSFFWWYDAMGQPLFGWHPPDGFPDSKEDWSSTMPMLQRWRMVNSLLNWKYGGEGENKDEYRIQFDGITPGDVTTPEQIVDFWSRRLLGYLLPENERVPVVDFMAYGRGTDSDLPAGQIQERLRYMIALILMSPSFQWR